MNHSTASRRAASPRIAVIPLATLSRLAVCALAVALVAGCASRSERRLIVGEAWAPVDFSPGLARQDTTKQALGEAYAQMLELAEQEPLGDGRTVGDLMDSSVYVAARVRLAIQRSPIKSLTFETNGHAVAKVFYIPRDIRRAARAAEAELS